MVDEGKCEQFQDHHSPVGNPSPWRISRAGYFFWHFFFVATVLAAGGSWWLLVAPVAPGRFCGFCGSWRLASVASMASMAAGSYGSSIIYRSINLSVKHVHQVHVVH